MQVTASILRKMEAERPRPVRLRWWQLSLRTLFVLLTLAGGLALFHEPIAAWAQNQWRQWFPPAQPKTPPPTFNPAFCPGCGMG